MTRRGITGTLAAALLAALSLPDRILAQSYPVRPMRMVIPYTPGGPTDLVGRALAERMQKILGQQVIVDNRAGGGGVIGSEIVARSNPDGYTLLLGTPGQLILLPLLNPKVPYRPSDFQPVTKVVDTPQVLIATAKLPASTVAELVAYAKQRPGEITYGSVQAGGTGHLGMELLKLATGMDMLHVPYKGTVPALTDLIAGRIQVMFSSLPTVQQHLQAKRIKILATGAPRRTPAIKDVPTIAETVPGYDLVTWYGIFVAPRTPAPIVNTLHRTLVDILTSPEIEQIFAAQGVEPAHMTPQALAQYMQAESKRWEKVIRAAGIRID